MIINKYTKVEIEKIYNLIINSPNRFILLRGGVAVGKTFYAKALACLLCQKKTEKSLTGAEVAKYGDETTIKEHCWISQIEENYQNADTISLVYFNQNTDYTNFVYGNIISTDAGSINYKPQEGIFLNIVKKAQKDASQNYVLILDDINRSDFSSTMGDILSAIEASGTGNEIHIGENTYVIPSNLYIIATYNPTIGCDVIDYAWQRRFFAYDIYSDERHIVSDEMVIRERNCIRGGLFWKDKDDKKGKYEILTDYIYHIYMQVKIMCERYLLESDFDTKKRLIPGHGLFLMYDEKKSLQENIIHFNNKLRYCIVPLLYQYLRDGLLDSEAMFDVEALAHLWDNQWECINKDSMNKTLIDTIQNGTEKAFGMKIMISLIGMVPDSVFYFFVMHNVLLMRTSENDEKCFLFETDYKKFSHICENRDRNKKNINKYHVEKQYLELGKTYYHSMDSCSGNESKINECEELGAGQIKLAYTIFNMIKAIIRTMEIQAYINGDRSIYNEEKIKEEFCRYIIECDEKNRLTGLQKIVGIVGGKIE